MLTLLIRTYGVDALNGPDFVMVELSPTFVERLDKRRALAQQMREADDGLDSLGFRDVHSVWFTHFEDQEELLEQTSNDGWTAVSSGLFSLPPEDGTGNPVLVSTDAERIQVWSTGFRFTCCMKHMEDIICSESVEFEDLNELLSVVSPEADKEAA